ncbi:MAG: tetratricopeptide repeat protein [Planctomycetes bacterium]|nr:tetratricopeptide repeat protein [Planctomycetota bacterium]
MLLQSGQVTEALAAYQKGLEISQKLAAADPSDAQAQRDLVFSHAKLGLAYRAAKEPAKSVAAFDQALAIARRLKAEGKLAGAIDGLIAALGSDRKKSADLDQPK